MRGRPDLGLEPRRGVGERRLPRRVHRRLRAANKKRLRSRQAGAACARCGMYRSYTAVPPRHPGPLTIARYVLLAVLRPRGHPAAQPMSVRLTMDA
ncbi:hypothetical protein ADT26_21745 [Xanthomonas oryzae]|nr:hypothetical protein ADT26_21745 [Xanthomonas oryzae]